MRSLLARSHSVAMTLRITVRMPLPCGTRTLLRAITRRTRPVTRRTRPVALRSRTLAVWTLTRLAELPLRSRSVRALARHIGHALLPRFVRLWLRWIAIFDARVLLWNLRN